MTLDLRKILTVFLDKPLSGRVLSKNIDRGNVQNFIRKYKDGSASASDIASEAASVLKLDNIVEFIDYRDQKELELLIQRSKDGYSL